MDPDTAIGGPHGHFPSTKLSLLQAVAGCLPSEALERGLQAKILSAIGRQG